MNNRIKVAVEFLKDGQSFLVDDLRLGINNLGDIEVTGWSKFTDFRNLTKINSVIEIEEIKRLFLKMVNSSIELKDFIKDKEINYVLDFDDYGKASVGICSEKNGMLKWYIDFTLLG